MRSADHAGKSAPRGVSSVSANGVGGAAPVDERSPFAMGAACVAVLR